METFIEKSKPSTQKAEILIVEDSFIIADNIEVILRKYGHEVIGIAKDLKEARQLITREKPDLVLLDIHLEKDTDGLEFAFQLNELQIPFIFVTSYADEATVATAKKSNPAGYLVKPFTEKDIYAAVEIALHKAAYLAISRQEQEKRILLDISTAIAKVRDKEDLWHVIVEKIKPIFNCSDAIISLINKEQTTAKIYLKQVIQEHYRHPEIINIFKRTYNIQEGHAATVLPEDSPIIWSIEDGMKSFPGTDYLQVMFELGIKEGVSVWIAYQEEKLGLLNLYSKSLDHFSPDQFELLQGIANQLAVAISNILANDEIQKRQREKDLQIAVTNAFKSGKEWQVIFQRVADEINNYVAIDFLNLLFPKDHKSFNCQKGPDGKFSQRTEQPEFLKGVRMDLDELKKSMKSSEMIYQTPDYYTGDKYDRFCEKHAISKRARAFYGLNSCMFIPLSLPNGSPAVLILGNKQEHAFNEDEFQVIKRLASQVAIAMENLLVYDEIKKLNEQLRHEKEYLEEEVELQYNFGEIVGSSDAIKKIFNYVQRVASTNTTVLITGETGTGKELIARAIHQRSDRKHQTFVKLNCAALPPELIESELFGHEKGAFTGALKTRIGKFELAHKGTIFLDEIGELPPAIQTKLLRVLQEREFERIGSNQVQKIDVRILAATNRHLQEEVQKGNFRSDLFYRLKVFPIPLPPLRERKEDIPLLANHFIQLKSRNTGKKFKAISDSFMTELINYNWPGNIRELEHVIEHAMILGGGRILDFKFQPQQAIESTRKKTPPETFIPRTLKEAEIELIMNTLKLCQGKVSGPGGAAEILGINSNTLESRLRKYGIQKRHVMKDSEN